MYASVYEGGRMIKRNTTQHYNDICLCCHTTVYDIQLKWYTTEYDTLVVYCTLLQYVGTSIDALSKKTYIG